MTSRSPSAPRSSPSERLVALLEQARRVTGASAVALADEQGLLIAGAGRYASCEVLAAWAPLSKHRGRVASTEVWGRPIHLCTSDPEALSPFAESLLHRAKQTLSPALRWVA
jgi:hypothetical protein